MSTSLAVLSRRLRVDLFASRPTLAEAMDYAHALTNTLSPADRIAALTALYVVLNTVANEIDNASDNPTAQQP